MSAPEPRSELAIGRYVALSFAGHVVAGASAIAYTLFAPAQRPLVDPNAVMIVSMAVAKSPDAMPHRAERAPKPAAVQAPEPVVAEPPPPNPSDLAFHDPKAKPEAAKPKAEPKRPSVNDLFDALDDIPSDAPEGKTNRAATSPDGVEGAPAGTQGSALGDPEFAAYIAKLRPLFLKNFSPLPALTGRDYTTQVLVRTDDTGAITSVTLFKTSGNPSWDDAAMRAAKAVTSVPLPPEHLKNRIQAGYVIQFQDPR